MHEPINPCSPSPCGQYSNCRELNDQAVCQCLPNYIGRAPNCRPECTVNSDCPIYLACINERCKDPCPGSCGHYAECHVQSHNPSCYCLPDYQGDPFNGCSKIPTQCKKKTFSSINLTHRYYTDTYYQYQNMLFVVQLTNTFRNKIAFMLIYIIHIWLSCCINV